MKFTLSWLRDHLETDADLKTIADALTRIGLEVEAIHNPAAQLAAFRIARVIEATPHPNADRLRVCMVDTGAGAPVQVVCGAPNARTGLSSVFAPPGTYIPAKKITLGTGVIRGVESAGMLCSAAELELSEDHQGIIELPDDAPVGTSYAQWAKLDDPVIEINLTPNRPDATSVAGIARDLAAAGLGRLKTPPIDAIAGSFPCPIGVSLDFAPDDAHLAPLFVLRLVRGVRNGPSPGWMQERLKAIGLRPINALVDITNYVTFDRGRPLHVFDARKVAGQLRVRRARTGEEVLALDGRSYKLTPDTIVIADDSGVESIAGIMGGEQSGCDETTEDVLIESALWDPINIARSGRALGIATDARYRFERGVDPAFCVPGAELATKLVLDLCGGAPSTLTIVGRQPAPATALLFSWSEVMRLTGLQLETSEMTGILASLGFAVAPTAGNSDRALVTPPTWRPDVEGAADLVEEIVRIAGLARVASVALPRLAEGVPQPVLTLLQKRTSHARRTLAARGLVEAVNWSFVSHAQAQAFGGGAAALALSNPIAANLSDMRPSLMPGLLLATQRNADRGYGDVALFEVGQIFMSDDARGQRTAAAALRRGTAKAEGSGRHWSRRAAPVDVFDAKADALALLLSLGIASAAVQVAPGGPDFLHPGRSGTLQFGPKNIVGWFGEVHPRVLEQLDVTGPFAAFEIVLDMLPPPKARPTRAKARLTLPDLMPVARDFAFLVDRSVPSAEILRAAQGAERTMITDASIFDVYEGAEIGEARKSIAISVTLQPREKTMTDTEIEAVATKIVADVAKKTGATLRS